MKYIIPFILVTIVSYSQSVENTEFDLDKETNICISSSTTSPIYLNPKISPIITGVSKKSFSQILIESIDSLGLRESTNGLIKIFVQFEKPHPIKVDRIGSKDFLLNNDQRETIRSKISSVSEYILGSTLGRPQNTLGIIYIDIENGKLKKIKYISIDFKH